MQRVVQRNIDIDRQSLRGFLHLVETEFPDELLRIRAPIDLRFEPTALVFELEQAGKSPVVFFENVGGQGMPLVTNIAANRQLLAACLGVAPANLPTAFRERCQNYIACETVARGAWDDVVIEGEDVDLTKLPIPLQFAVDAAPYITAGQIVARDPVTGVDTTGFHRLMVKGRNRLGVSLHSRRRLFEYHRRAEQKGESLPAVVTLGTHPLHYMGSMVYAYPPQVRKYEIIGGLFGEPYRLARRRAGGRLVAGGPISKCRPAPRSSSKARFSPMSMSRKGHSANSPAMPHTAAPRTCLSLIASACGATLCCTV